MSPTLLPSGTPGPAAPSTSPTPAGQYSIDLYQTGDFVGEFNNTWCVPAAMQTMQNIMNSRLGRDQGRRKAISSTWPTRSTESRNGSPDPEGLTGRA